MQKKCPCGNVINNIKPSRFERTKYCSKACFYKYHGRKSGLKYNIIKENPTWFKKGDKPYNFGFPPELHPQWKGDDVGYWGIHSWVEKTLGKPKKCELCGTESAKRFDWSNKSGNYKRNTKDWQRLCVSCHFNYDKQKFGARKNFQRAQKSTD